MRVYISTDMEGVCGINTRDVWDSNSHIYREGRMLLTKEVNAAVEGALEGGAKEVVVLDGHGGGRHFILAKLHPEARYEVTSGGRNIFPSLDETFDAVFLIGYHAMAGTMQAFLDHTQSSSWFNYYLNGRKVGEIGQEAAIAGHYRVPVVLVTGDEAATKEARELLGDEIETVAVKKAYRRFSASSMHPKNARHLIREASKRALSKTKLIKPFRLTTPIEVMVTFATTDLADDLATHEGINRVDSRTITKKVNTALEILNL